MSSTALLDDIRQKHQFFDQFCAAWISDYSRNGSTIHCEKGCNGCCNLVVNCTAMEAIMIAKQLNEDQKNRLYNQIPQIKSAAQQAGLLKEWLLLYRQQAGPCPFLEQDKSCGIYQVRPISCRSLHSTREPHWCSTDFSQLSSELKQEFMAKLDRSVVAFPTHYVATLQEVGQELESSALASMEKQYGYYMLGNLPWLVWLTLEHQLEEMLAEGAEQVRNQLGASGLMQHYLIVCSD